MAAIPLFAIEACALTFGAALAIEMRREIGWVAASPSAVAVIATILWPLAFKDLIVGGERPSVQVPTLRSPVPFKKNKSRQGAEIASNSSATERETRAILPTGTR